MRELSTDSLSQARPLDLAQHPPPPPPGVGPWALPSHSALSPHHDCDCGSDVVCFFKLTKL